MRGAPSNRRNTRGNDSDLKSAMDDEESMWRPVSHIYSRHVDEKDQDFTLMSKEDKRIEMSEKIEDLIEKNAEYFRGKELLFDN